MAIHITIRIWEFLLPASAEECTLQIILSVVFSAVAIIAILFQQLSHHTSLSPQTCCISIFPDYSRQQSLNGKKLPCYLSANFLLDVYNTFQQWQKITPVKSRFRFYQVISTSRMYYEPCDLCSLYATPYP